jgi:hypothetical protein
MVADVVANNSGVRFDADTYPVDMRVPIACTLSESAARNQIGEWRTVVARSVVAVERRSSSSVSMTLQADLVGLTELVKLAQREKACCGFFEFDLAIDADRVRFRVTVPEEASDVLDEFAQLDADDLEV